MTQASYMHSFVLLEKEEKRLQKLMKKGVRIVEVVRVGIRTIEDEKEKGGKNE